MVEIKVIKSNIVLKVTETEDKQESKQCLAKQLRVLNQHFTLAFSPFSALCSLLCSLCCS